MGALDASGTLRVAICVAGIYTCYLYYGVLQEQIYRPDKVDGSRFQFTFFLLFVQCFVNFLVACVGYIAFGDAPGAKSLSAVVSAARSPLPGVPVRGVMFLGIVSLTYMLAMFCSNESIKWVAYPTQALGKSVKIVPVMLFNVLLAKRRYSFREYAQVALITAGIVVFNFGKARKADGSVDHPLGILLLLGSLCCDGVTGSYQRVFMDEYRPSTHKLMAGMNLWSLVILALPLLFTGQAVQGVTYCLEHPRIVRDIFRFSICSALGQNFIFYAITGPGPLVCATITTTRKFFTILLSVLLHPDNSLAPVQWGAVSLVFVGLGGEIHGKWAKSRSGGGGGGGGGNGSSSGSGGGGGGGPVAYSKVSVVDDDGPVRAVALTPRAGAAAAGQPHTV